MSDFPLALEGPLDNAIGASLAGARLRAANADAWNEVAKRVDYFPVEYSSPVLDYQLVSRAAAGYAAVDVSLVLYHDNRPCGLWPLLAALQGDGSWALGGHGGAFLPPLFAASLARKSAKALLAACLRFIAEYCRLTGARTCESAESVVGRFGLSDWHDLVMGAGARCEVSHELFVDLSLSPAEIKSAFRKSYKSLITSGLALWDVTLLRAADAAVWDEFRELHKAVAGRATRDEASWAVQHASIAAGMGFLVCLRDATGRLVGGGFFQITGDEGVYATAAYERSLFDKPLGHVVQHTAIMEMKERGLRWYKLGTRSYPGDEPAPSEKEISIANFKQGFSTHLVPRYRLRWDCT